MANNFIVVQRKVELDEKGNPIASEQITAGVRTAGKAAKVVTQQFARQGAILEKETEYENGTILKSGYVPNEDSTGIERIITIDSIQLGGIPE